MAYKRFSEWCKLKEVGANIASAGDPDAFNQAVSQNINQQQGGDKSAGGAKGVDPKAVMNKAVLDAAKSDPTAAATALNLKPGEIAMKKKMKKSKKR